MYKTVSLTREEMFDRVWSTPLLQLAKEIGVSDVALGKACRRAKIPLPGRGYWAKDAKARSKPKLPRNHDAFYDTISFRVLDAEAHAAVLASKKSMPAPVSDGESGGSTADSGKDAAIVVPATLEAPHPLVARTLKLARAADVFEGRLSLDFKEALSVRISADMLDRALLVLDTLIKESERRGCTWAVTKEGTTTVTYEGEPMKVELKERLIRREIPPPPPPPRPGRRARWQPDYTPTYYPTKEWVSSGELTFLIDERGGHDVRGNWKDTKRTPIDTRLADILDGLAGMAAGIKAEREKRAEWERKRKLEEARQATLAREAERVRLLRTRLVASMQRWEQAGHLRRFTSAVEAHLAHMDDAGVAAGRRWLAWAREQADLLDPVISDLAGITSLTATVPSWFTGRGSWEKQPFDWWASAGMEQPDDENDAEDEAPLVEEVPDPSAHWRRVRSGWYGR